MKKTKQKRSYKFRAVIKKKSLYFYNCDGCGKKRSSRIYERALGKICQVCLKNKVPENQQSLLVGIDMAEGESKTVVNCFRCNDNGCPSCEPTNGFNLKDGI